MSTLPSAFPSFNRGKACCWNPSWLHQCFWTHERWMRTKSIFISVAHLITAAKLPWVSTLKQISNLIRSENFSWHLPGVSASASITQQHLPLSWALGSGAPAQISQSDARAPTQDWTSGTPALHLPVCLCMAPQLCRHAKLPRATIQLPCCSYLLGGAWHSWGSPNTHLCPARVLSNTPAGTLVPEPPANLANLARRPL